MTLLPRQCQGLPGDNLQAVLAGEVDTAEGL